MKPNKKTKLKLEAELTILRHKIVHHKKLYYMEDNHEIDDGQFDSLEIIRDAITNKYPSLSLPIDSLTGYPVVEHKQKEEELGRKISAVELCFGVAKVDGGKE